MNVKSYRPDIDGLRAVSVISVVLYHFGIAPFTGGFVGVDVFFVISGYLITSLLWRDIVAGQFSLLGFYDRRFRRILPAMLAVVGLSLAAGYFLLMPGDYESLGWQSVYSVLGIANFYFLWNTGYFDQSADVLPMLHMWSLAVEEQYYVLWPLLLAGLAFLTKGSRHAIIVALVAIIVLSFTAAVLTVPVNSSIAFYMLHTRAWELALGALLVFLPAISMRLLSEVLSIVGLVLVGSAIFLLNSDSPFPGYNALYPCLGAALIIWPKSHPTLCSRLLSLEPARQIGLASYSLYLWHWPVLVFFRHWNLGEMPTGLEAFALIAFCVGLSFLSLHFVERPFRRMKMSRAGTVTAGLAGMLLFSAPAYAIGHGEGYPRRINAEVEGLLSLKEMWRWSCRSEKISGFGKLCVIGDDWNGSDRKMVLWGDSHAEHFAPLVEAVLAGRKGVSVALVKGCAPIFGGVIHGRDKNPARSEKRCKAIHNKALKFIRKSTDISAVFVAAAWSGKLNNLYVESADEPPSETRGAVLMRDGILDLQKKLQSKQRRTIFLSDFPKWEVDPVACATAAASGLLRRDCSSEMSAITLEEFRERHGVHEAAIRAAATLPNTFAVSPGEATCGSGICESVFNGEFIYRDRGHLRRNLSLETRRLLADRIGLTKQLAGPQTATSSLHP